MTQRTYYPPTDPHLLLPSDPWVPPVAHGYTIPVLRRLARLAVDTAWAQGSDYHERYDAAWLGIVEHLVAAESKPSSGVLVHAGQQAINRHVEDDRRDRAGRGWSKYWVWTARHTPDHGQAVTDRAATMQILAALTERHRNAITALAICEDYRRAADMLGLSYTGYHTALRQARSAFLALWHEGEAPSALWGSDRRRWRADVEPATDRRPTLVRRRAAVRRRQRDLGGTG